jgi:ElaB/YqjD/DUF883 family membrane-anchored ribosome-binding protein
MQSAKQLENKAHSKINKALTILQSIDSDDLDAVEDKFYDSLNAKWIQAKDQISEFAERTKSDFNNQVKRIDQKAHKDPWKLVGAGILLGAVSGFFLGSKKN